MQKNSRKLKQWQLKNQINERVFGTRPTDSIYLPDVPYSVRLNCKDGGLFVGGSEAQHRKTNPDQSIDISIIKVSKFFGSLGKTKNVLWLQLFYVAAPGVDSNILPKNTVCCSYIKKQSIAHLFNKVLEVMDHDDPGFGIFTLSFNREVGENGVYYSVDFDWRSAFGWHCVIARVRGRTTTTKSNWCFHVELSKSAN